MKRVYSIYALKYRVIGKPKSWQRAAISKHNLSSSVTTSSNVLPCSAELSLKFFSSLFAKYAVLLVQHVYIYIHQYMYPMKRIDVIMYTLLTALYNSLLIRYLIIVPLWASGCPIYIPII